MKLKIGDELPRHDDEPVVHTGYRWYRDNLVRSGADIFELHPTLGPLADDNVSWSDLKRSVPWGHPVARALPM